MKNERIVEKTEAPAMPGYNQLISKAAYLAENKRLAKQGDKFAQFKLAYQYMTGYGDVPIDRDEAIFWYTQSAEQGFASAYIRLAELYMSRLKSEDVHPIEAKQAAHYLLLLHDTLSPLAHVAAEHLRSLLRYLEEDFIQNNTTLSSIRTTLMSTLRKQADVENDAKAQCELGLIYLTGIYGMKKDADLGFIYIKRSAEQGFSTAQAILASIYIASESSIPTDLGKAAAWVRKSMDSAQTEQESQAAEEMGAFLVKCALERIQLMAQKPK